MKKFVYILMTVLAVGMISCNKEKKNGEGEDDGPLYRIKSLSYTDNWYEEGLPNHEDPDEIGWYDTWTYTYDAQGRVIKVFREEGKPQKNWTLSYEGNKVTITREDGKEILTLELNAKGVCTSIKDDVKESEWGPYDETAVFEYDATNRPTKITKEGELRSVITLRDNCLVSWTKEKDSRKRTFTYSNTKNLGDLHEIYSEAIDPPARWLYETGLFGHGPAYLVATSVWEDDPENGSTITHKLDENGYVLWEKKVFPGGGTEFFKIEWEEIK